MVENEGMAPIQASEAAANARVVARSIRAIAGVEGAAVPKVSIRDFDAVEDILFAEVEGYLVDTDWTLAGQLGDRPIAVYEKDGYEVLVGRRDDYADRPQRVAQIIEMVAENEGRSELEVYWDIRVGRHGTEGAGFVVLPHNADNPPEVVTVEVPIPLYGGDRLTVYVVGGRANGAEPRRLTLTDNSQVIMQTVGNKDLSGFQLGLVDAALRAINPIFPSVRLSDTELTLQVETDDLGSGIVLFSQLCAQVALICRLDGGEPTNKETGRRISDN